MRGLPTLTAGQAETCGDGRHGRCEAWELHSSRDLSCRHLRWESGVSPGLLPPFSYMGRLGHPVGWTQAPWVLSDFGEGLQKAMKVLRKQLVSPYVGDQENQSQMLRRHIWLCRQAESDDSGNTVC